MLAIPKPQPLPLPPGPRNPFLFGALRKDPLGFFTGLQRTWGDVVRLRVGPRPVCLVSHPDGVRRVLQDHARLYSKQTRGFDTLRELLGNGLLTSEGDFWLRQRRLAQPAFHRQRLAGFGATMVAAAEQVAQQWEEAARGGEATVDVAGAMMRLTLKVAGQTLFGADVSEEARTISEALAVVLPYANRRILQPLALPRSLPTPANRAATRASARLDAVVRGLITRRRQEGPRDDLLSMLMEARDEESGERMDDTQLRDEVLTLLLAGHETTANALCWTWVLLARHPEAHAQLLSELEAVLGGRAPSVEDVPRLLYTRQVVDESLRLYPPAWMFSRAPLQEDEVGGYRVTPGTFVLLSPWVTQHREDLWEAPEAFRPERFRPERAAALPRFAYFPFGGGPRQCIGNGFALLELVLVLATLAQRVRLTLAPGQTVVPEPTITLRPRGGLSMRVARA